MELTQWPLVARHQVVQVFRPGSPASKEAPFRTLRRHRWTTAGVSVVTREKERASGRFTIYSVLNVHAARCAREGDTKDASDFAAVAASLEGGAAFARLRSLLSGKPTADVSAIVDGDVREDRWPELSEALRLVARDTVEAQSRCRGRKKLPVLVVGRVSEAGRDLLVLEGESGIRTAVPRWLTRSVHRDHVGDYLALVTDRFDEHCMIVNARPAIALHRERPGTRFSPFGRQAPVRGLTKGDVRVLSRSPAPLEVLVPVTIES